MFRLQRKEDAEKDFLFLHMPFDQQKELENYDVCLFLHILLVKLLFIDNKKRFSLLITKGEDFPTTSD